MNTAERKIGLFVINTPLQAYAALQALDRFAIGQYEIYAMNRATTAYLDAKNVPYSKIPIVDYPYKLKVLLKMFLPFRLKRFDYLFIGLSHPVLLAKRSFLPQVKNGGKIVYLDDGNVIIPWFHDECSFKEKDQIKLWFEKIVTGVRKIEDNVYYTMYDDLEHKNYRVVPWVLNEIIQGAGCSVIREVYFVGTTLLYNRSVDINEYQARLKKCLEDIRHLYPNTTLIYVPHVSDSGGEIQLTVQSCGWEFRRLNTIIEEYFITERKCPIALYGFSSSALYSMRKLFPELSIGNVIMPGLKDAGVWLNIRKYYEKHGIESIYL